MIINVYIKNKETYNSLLGNAVKSQNLPIIN